MLIKYHDPFMGEWVYEWIRGIIYGEQPGAATWKRTLCHRLTFNMGFKEVMNMESMYHHPEHKTDISCHVDDPLVKTVAAEKRVEFYKELNKHFQTKGVKVLSPEQALDYLSMRISMGADGSIRIDNEIKIDGYLRDKGMTGCNPVATPIDKNLVNKLYKSLLSGATQSQEDQDMTAKWLGEAQWLSQTTHPNIATAVSIYSSILKHNVEGGLDAMKHLMRFLAGKKSHCLVKRAGVKSGLKVYTDADWAGLYAPSLGQELRSRSGIYMEYDGMTIAWHSHFQHCTGMNYDPTRVYDSAIIAQSSADSETHAASDAAKAALHIKYIGEELGIDMPVKIPILIDAGAAMGFIANTGGGGKMKYIDIRVSWVQSLRNREHFRWFKVPGTENKADFFTKILPSKAFKEYEAEMQFAAD